MMEATIGGIFAYAGREREQRRSFLKDNIFHGGLLYSALVYVPAAMWFVWKWPDWSAHNVIRFASSQSVLAFAAADAVLLFVGYVVGYRAYAAALMKGERKGVHLIAGAAWALAL